MMHKFDALILGAGAAGLMCAIEAGKLGRRVAVIERADRIGKKILISGGGRCNFTNIHCQPENFISGNPHFARSALARYTPDDFIALVERHRIPYHEKTLGQLFCDRSAQDITKMLEAECRAARVELFLNRRIQTVERTTPYVVRAEVDEFRAPALVVACGGLSIPKLGATRLGYDLAQRFGLRVRKTMPGLVPLVLGPEDQSRYCDLAGVSAWVEAAVGRHSFQEKMLITHRGLSGPAILQASSYWRQGEAIQIDLAPTRDVLKSIPMAPQRNAAVARAALQDFLPKRLATRWLDIHAPKSWTNLALEEMKRKLHAWTLTPVDTEGYGKAEVTVGGVDTDELSDKTMESRRVPGLFFIGEVVDVTGHLGGFNFQWAWASGAAAGRAL
ncbi:MAG TPA: NAD(P)/FAD-dependent oxidoreductase [Terriglobia bacterium]|nr:NAD(P)/FAD-dependent oxidoreductase [Terriglobia bacterium]